MKDLVWDQVLSVEVEEIDEDHRKLLGIFNLLNHALIDGESSDYLAAILEELINFTVWHFSHEERLMLKYDYAGIEDHRRIHRELIESAGQLQQKFLQSRHALADEDIVFLEHWLTEHILTDDMRLGNYLSQVM